MTCQRVLTGTSPPTAWQGSLFWCHPYPVFIHFLHVVEGAILLTPTACHQKVIDPWGWKWEHTHTHTLIYYILMTNLLDVCSWMSQDLILVICVLPLFPKIPLKMALEVRRPPARPFLSPPSPAALMRLLAVGRETQVKMCCSTTGG